MNKAMDIVLIARDIERKKTLEYIQSICEYFVELHGDREFGDDRAIIGGIGLINKMPVTIIAQQKGKNIKENKKRNYGMAKPEGYRKAKRLIKQAEKFNRPILTFVDTPGASCGREAEERNQGCAIADCIQTIITAKVPTLSIVTGEGGSGGALALSATDEIWMLENSIYSILSPEGFASILWKDSTRKDEAAQLMRLTARELKEYGHIDRIILEEYNMLEILKQEIIEFFKNKKEVDRETLVERRYDRYRNVK